MSPESIAQYALYVLIAVFIIYRQLAPRQIRSGGRLAILPVLLTGYGLYSMLQTPPAGGDAYLLLAGQLVISAVAGVVRGLTIKFYVNAEGVPMQRGTWLTIVVWLAYIALRVGSYFVAAGALGTPEILLSIGVTLLVQAGMTYLRGQAMLQSAGQAQSASR